MPQVSIIIVNYNTKDITINCLKSIYEQTQDIDFEIILVDNDSSDGSVEAIKKQFSDVKIIEPKENLGFGKANNLGAKYAKGEFLFLLNSDTLLIENSIKKLYNFYIENEQKLNIGVLGAIMVDENRSINGFGSEIPNVTELKYKNLRKIPFLRSFFRKNEKSYRFSDTYFEIGYVLGADMFIRKSKFQQAKGFDENYFMYYEESDLQLFMRKNGFRHYIYTPTKIIHLEGKSFAKPISNAKRIIVHSSEVYFAKKNYPRQYFGFKMIDILFLLFSVINFKYSFKENYKYIKIILGKY